MFCLSLRALLPPCSQRFRIFLCVPLCPLWLRFIRWYHTPVPPLLDVRNLSISFPGQGQPSLTAVRDLSFTLAPREVLGLVGESGSGKSLTALALMRLLPPTAHATGEIMFSNTAATHNLLQLPDEQMRALRGSQIAM